jgi:transcription termination factor Rho
VLDRKLADRRIFPAIDIQQSGTRKEERLLPPNVLKQVTLLRRSLISLPPVQAMEALVNKLADYPSNAAFLERVGSFAK